MNLLYTHRLEVRFVDCDSFGHVNNAVYLSYLEQARFGLWRRLWNFTRETATTAAGGAGVILARVECDYRSQATYGDLLDVRVGLAAIGRTSFTYDYEIADAGTGRLVAEARTVLVMYDYRAERPVPIDEARRASLSRSFVVIEIFGKDACPYTRAAIEAYKPQGAVYIDVKQDPKALERMLELSKGRRAVPVIVEDGKVTVGYGGS